MNSRAGSSPLESLRDQWLARWPAALAVWSRYVQLHEPTWCFNEQDEQREQLSGSFAMIRLVDHSVVISLRQVAEHRLEPFALEVLAHEIGHHVYCPADLTDNARLLTRMRRALPTLEPLAPMVSNLYSDLLINDRLQRTAELDMAGVYLRLGSGSQEKMWTLYMRIYELLWNRERGTLATGPCDARMNQDAQLGARLIRHCARDWLYGAGKFAALCLPYLIEDDQQRLQRRLAAWSDTRDAGRGGLPDGFAEMDDDEATGAIHPSEDPAINGIEPEADDDQPSGLPRGRTPGELSGRKSLRNYRQPFEYAEVLQAAGAQLDARALVARYYQELARPHLIPFPSRRQPQSVEPHPEGLEMWDVDAPLDQIDWWSTLLASPLVVPGVTTRQRLYGDAAGQDPDALPLDLYLGVDCSGSMGDPAHHLSYPVLAGAILALSALRAGARVKVVLSGEPGSTVSTEGFLRELPTVLRTLVSYLGTGYSFGIHRLAETFSDARRALRPAHVLIISDHDMFSMLDSESDGRRGWDVAREALERCGGGGTFVLQLAYRPASATKSLERMQREGWSVSLVNDLAELVEFARQFSRRTYHASEHSPLRR